MAIGFDNELYMTKQKEHILERISRFDGKLYLEFGGKLFDDYHAARVLPGFMPDSKINMLLKLKDQAEIVIVISAESRDMRFFSKEELKERVNPEYILNVIKELSDLPELN